MSSPRTWGCFLGYVDGVVGQAVFPTHVGVFPLFGVVVTSLLVMAALGDWAGNQRMDDE